MTGSGTFTYSNTFRYIRLDDTRTQAIWTGLTANGASGTATTTQLTLTFAADPGALATGNIAVTGATVDNVSGSGTTRTVDITLGITVNNGDIVTVTITNPAPMTVNISPLERTVAVYKDTSGETPPTNTRRKRGDDGGCGNTGVGTLGALVMLAAYIGRRKRV